MPKKGETEVFVKNWLINVVLGIAFMVVYTLFVALALNCF
jgi:hypothetical protein